MTASKTMTAAQWKATHSDFKTTIEGERFVLALDPTTGGTVLAPVVVVEG